MHHQFWQMPTVLEMVISENRVIEETLVHEVRRRNFFHKYWIFDKHGSVSVNECLQDAVFLVGCQEDVCFNLLICLCCVQNAIHAQIVIKSFDLLSYACCANVRIFDIPKRRHWEKWLFIVWLDKLVAEMALLEFFFYSLSHSFDALVFRFLVYWVLNLSCCSICLMK